MLILLAAACFAMVGESSPVLFSGGQRIESDSSGTCGMYLIPSTLPGAGRGIVAGTNFSDGDRIEIIPTISIRDSTMDACQLKNYGFGSGHNDFTLVIYGPGNIYNHRKPHTLGRFWAYEEDKDPTKVILPYTDYKSVLYNVKFPITAGEEMFETYGDHWFARFSSDPSDTKSRNVHQAAREAMVMDISDLKKYGHCLTDVRIKPSRIPGAGNGLFAARDFAPGEVVTISPTLTLPRSVVDDSESSSVLKNYCFATPDSDLVLFPLNYGPMINHNNTRPANVHIDWYDWSPADEAIAAKYKQPGDPELDKDHNLRLSDKLQRTVNDLFNAPFAQLDIAYKATTPIRKGEQLFLNYGKEWEVAWNVYSERFAEWEARNKGSELDITPKSDMPQFRHYMNVPDGMYPAQWMKQPDTECGMFLVPSTIPGAGRGVVAGRAYHKEEVIENIPTITISSYAADNSQLKNYVFGTGHNDFHLVIFGPGNIYNHRKPHTLGRYGGSEDKDPTKAPLPYTDFTKILYSTLANIETGEEMYETYGDHWFNRFTEATDYEGTTAPRSVQQASREALRMNVSDMIEYGHCLTDIRVADSTIAGAGHGLFANRDFALGEVVTISPVLSLPRKVVEEGSADTVLMNYCFSVPNSDLVLFPLNYGPLINHNAPEQVNVDVGWHDWSPAVEALSAKYRREGDPEPDPSHNLRLADKLAMSVQELSEAPFGQLDIAYKATRPIQRGEELFLNYGAEWQAAWDAYANKMKEWEDEVKVETEDDVSKRVAALRLNKLQNHKPNFRSFLKFPASLYAPQWFRPLHQLEDL